MDGAPATRVNSPSTEVKAPSIRVTEGTSPTPIAAAKEGLSSSAGPAAESTPPPLPGANLPIEGRPFQGPEDAPVVLVEFTDYECPFCARFFHTTAPKLLADYEGKVKYVVLNFPVAAIHPRAVKAAEAAECAADQGRFWEYHDTLFRNQRALDEESLIKHAEALGLSMPEFTSCLDSGSKREMLVQHLQAGIDAGVRGTPTFFINGQRLTGARPYNIFQRIFDSVLDGQQSAGQ